MQVDQMFAVKSTADESRYTAVTRRMGPGSLVQCPRCNEPYILYAEVNSVNAARKRLSEYLVRQCPRHVEFIADEAA